MSRGLVHLYCGDGKGKTTAALGLGLRACGRGLRVLLVRFLKDERSGELEPLAGLPGFTILETPQKLPFVPKMSLLEKQAYQAYARQMLDAAKRAALGGQCDLLILDEAAAAAHHGMVAQEEITQLLQTRPSSLEVVLTGRNPPCRSGD